MDLYIIFMFKFYLKSSFIVYNIFFNNKLKGIKTSFYNLDH